MIRYKVYAQVVGSKFIGEVEANSPEEACAKLESEAWVNLCHQCADEIDDPQVTELTAEACP